jgi:PAS domain S-box-containing protein
MKNLKILIVDNSLMFLALLSDLLKEEGFRVKTAVDGKEGLEEIKRDPPDILFVELILPKISGEQLIQYIKETPGLANMIIVVVSGALNEYSRLEQLGANYYLEKRDIDTFRRKVREICQKIRLKEEQKAPSIIPESTLRKREIVEKLLANRQQIQQISISLREGLIIYDFDYKILEANPATEEFLGKSLNALMGTFVEDHFGLSYRDSIRGIVEQVSKGERKYACLTASVGDKILELRFSIFKDVWKGSRPGGILLIYDLTQQKKAERNMEKLHKYLRASASISSLLIPGEERVCDQVGDVLELMGMTASASRCYWFENHKDRSGRLLVSQRTEWCAEGIEPQIDNPELQNLAYENCPRWFRELSSGRIISGPISDFPDEERAVLEPQNIKFILVIPLFIKGNFEGFLGFDNCVSATPWQEPEVNLLHSAVDSLAKAFEHEKSDKEIKESETRYRNIFENIYDIWYLHDMEGRVLEVNPAFERIAGYHEKELLSMTIQDLIPERYKEQFDDNLKELQRRGKVEGLVHIVTKSGEEKILEYRNWLVELPGRETASRGLAKDVTDRINLEAQLKRAQRMESIGIIASGISHNFRNILTGIMVNSQLIQMKYQENNELHKYASGIINLAKTGADLIRSLLQFSSKRSKGQKGVFNLTGVLHETYQIISTSFDKKIEIRKEWPELLPIEGDRSELGQVFMNLCTNARDAMANGGLLQIEGRNEGNRIGIIISDTGCGMDKKIVERIFDPFFTTKDPDKGTGLGLSTAYGIIKDHGGEIHMDSQPGLGTSLKIYFPIPKAEEPCQEKSSHEVLPGKGQKILIVDDDETVLQPMEEALTNMGYKTSSADSGQGAIEKYKAWVPDVVLMDRNMPGMDGLTASKHILSIDPEARIVLVSGYDEEGPDGIDDNIRSLINGYITKPFDIKEISRILTGVVDK